MDVISGVAAGVQLGGHLVKVSHEAFKLGQRLANAPQRLRYKRIYVDQLHTYTEAIQTLFQGPHSQHDPRNYPLPPYQISALQGLLNKIQKEFEELGPILEPLEDAFDSNDSIKRFWARVRTLKQDDSIHGCLDRLGYFATHLDYFVKLHHFELFYVTSARAEGTLGDISHSQTDLNAKVTRTHQLFDEKAAIDAQAWSTNSLSQEKIITQGRAIQEKLDALDLKLDLGFIQAVNQIDKELGEVSKIIKTSPSLVQLLSAKRLASKPSLLASTLEQCQRISSRKCPCQRSGRASPGKFGPVKWTWRSYGTHSPGCPNHDPTSDNTMANQYSLTISSLAFRAIEIVFNSAQGAGGFALPERIDFISIVSDDEAHVWGFGRIDTAHCLLQKLRRRHRHLECTRPSHTSNQGAKEILGTLWHDLTTDFRDRRFSARLQNTDGMTLLHRFIEMLVETKTFQEDILSTVKGVIDLLLRNGVPLNSVVQGKRKWRMGDDGLMHRATACGTALSAYLPEFECSNYPTSDDRLFLQALSDIGIDGSRHEDTPASAFTCVRLLSAVPDLAIDYGCSKLVLAIVNRDLEKIRHIVKTKGIQDPYTPSPLTPLCFCVNWPAGMKILLEAGANPSEATICAIDNDDDIGLELLLKAGSRLFTPLDEPLMRRSWGLGGDVFSLLEYALRQRMHRRTSMHPRILPLIVNALANSRKKLMSLARAHISYSQLRNLGWQTPRSDSPLLDSPSAITIFEELQLKSVEVSDNVRPDSHGASIYHNWYMTADVADSIFGAGFQDVDATALDGTTPLLLVLIDRLYSGRWFERRFVSRFDHRAERWYEHLSRTVDIVSWFLNHGAQKLGFPEFNGISIGQLITGRLTFEDQNFVSPRYRKLWNRLIFRILARLSSGLLGPARDYCKCYCSSGGCSPLTTLLRKVRAVLPDRPRTEAERRDFNLWDRRRRTFAVWLLINPLHRNQGAAIEFCRFELFERLGMRHTCCDFLDKYDVIGSKHYIRVGNLALHFVDPIEAAEFQDEDRFMNEVLEHVMDLFVELEVLYKQHLTIFWEGWWNIIKETIPITQWRRSEKYWFEAERIDTEIPILQEGMLETHLRDIREHVSSWVEEQIELLSAHDTQMEEGMLWLKGVLEG